MISIEKEKICVPDNAIRKYTLIMKMYSELGPLDTNFQRLFVGFYRVRRDAFFRKIYFELMKTAKEEKLNFSEILVKIFEQTGRIEPSFSSKLLATIAPEYPIWDRYILEKLGLENKRYFKNKDEQIRYCVGTYNKIVNWYRMFLEQNQAKELIDYFDSTYQEYLGISDIKKMDFILWSYR